MARKNSLIFLFLMGCAAGNVPFMTDLLSQQEKKDGWKMLFDGKSISGWHIYNNESNGSAWKIKDGELFLDPSDKGRGDIVSDQQYENFELVLEWKIEPCGNSGIMINTIESSKYREPWNTGPEMQVLDNVCHEDGTVATHRAGSLYDILPVATESVKKANEWNLVRIISNKGHLEFWLNNTKQIETTMFTPEWDAMVQGSKFKAYPDFAKSRKGHIVLQDHDNRVWFRNIKIRELT